MKQLKTFFFLILSIAAVFLFCSSAAAQYCPPTLHCPSWSFNPDPPASTIDIGKEYYFGIKADPAKFPTSWPDGGYNCAATTGDGPQWKLFAQWGAINTTAGQKINFSFTPPNSFQVRSIQGDAVTLRCNVYAKFCDPWPWCTDHTAGVIKYSYAKLHPLRDLSVGSTTVNKQEYNYQTASNSIQMSRGAQYHVENDGTSYFTSGYSISLTGDFQIKPGGMLIAKIVEPTR